MLARQTLRLRGEHQRTFNALVRKQIAHHFGGAEFAVGVR
jgi:Porin subfamily